MEGNKNVFCIKWDSFRTSLTDGFQDFFRDESMVDVTLGAEGKLIKAHKVVLSVCSPYLKILLESTPCHHPTVLIADIKYNVLSNILEFMYNGETKIQHQNIPAFLKLASKLQVKGLVNEAVKLLKNLMALKSGGNKKKKVRQSLIAMKKMTLLQRIKARKKMKNKQRTQRLTRNRKKSKQNVVEGSVSRESAGTSAQMESGIQHRDDNYNYGKNNISSSDLLLDKNDNESTQESSKSQNNLKFGIRDYFENFTIEDSEESNAHHDSSHAQNSFEYQPVHFILSDVAHVSQSHKQNNMASCMEHTLQNQRQVDNVLPDNIRVTSQIPKVIDLQSVSQNDMSKILANIRQHEELNNALNVQSSIQNDVQRYSNNVPIAPPISEDLFSRLTVQSGSPINDEYSEKRNVQTAVPIDKQYSLRRTQNDLLNNVPYSPQRRLDNDEYPSKSVGHDMQRPIQGGVHNVSPSRRYPLPRDVENISPFQATSPVKRDFQNNSSQDLWCSLRKMENASPNDVPYPVQNVVQRGVEYPIQTAAPIDVHYSLRRSLENVEKTSSNDVRDSSHLSQKHLQGASTSYLKRSRVQCVSTDEQKPGGSKNDMPDIRGFQPKRRKISLSYLKKDPRKNVHYALSSCTEFEEENNEQDVIQNNPQENVLKNVQYDKNYMAESVGHNIQAGAPQEYQENAVKSNANIAEEVRFSSQIQAKTSLQNSAKKLLQNDVQGSQEKVQNAHKKSAKNVKPSEVQSTSQIQDLQNSGQRVLRSNLIDSKKKVQNVSKNDAISVDSNEVKSSSQSPDRIGPQNSGQRVLRSYVDSKKKVQNVAKNDAISVDSNEVKSSSQSSDRIGPQNSGQRVLRSNLQGPKKKLRNQRVMRSHLRNSKKISKNVSKKSAISGQRVLRSNLLDSKKKLRNLSKSGAKSVEQTEVSKSFLQSRTQMDSLSSEQKVMRNIAKDVQKKGSKRSAEIGEPSEVLLHEEKSEWNASWNELRKFLYERALGGTINSGGSNSEELQVVEQTKPEMVSEQSAHPRSIESPVLIDAQDEHSDDEHRSGDEHGELQIVLETEGQPKVQFASKRKDEIVENEEVVTKTQVKISSQKTGEPFALENDAEDSRKAAQYVPRRRPGNDEAQFLSQTESEADLQISEQSVAQGKRHTVSQNKKENDVRNVLALDLKNDPHKNVQCSQDNNSNDYKDSDDIPFIIGTEEKTKSTELEDVLRNIRLDTWESMKRKKEDSVIETSNDSIEVEKDTEDRSVLGNRQKKSVKSIKEELKDLEIRSISPEEVITECDVESNINSNVNNDDQNLTKYYAQYEMEEKSQTNPEVTVNNDEKNISRRKLPILQSMLEENPLNQVQYFSQNDVKNVSKSSKSVRTKRQSTAKKRKTGTVIRDRLSPPINVQENSTREIPRPVKNDTGISFQTYSRRLFEKHLRKSDYSSENDAKKNKPSESQESDSSNDLQETLTTPDQNAPSKSDGNNNPSFEPESVLESYAKMNLQIPIQIIFRSDLEKSGLQSDEQSQNQRGQRRPAQYTFINAEKYLGESEKQFVGQNDLQENSKSNVSNGEAQSLNPDTPPVYPLSHMKYSLVTDLSNIARRTVQVVQDDAQMDLDSDVPNIVQITPQSHVQHSVRNDVNKDASTDLPEAQSHYQNQEGGGQSYRIICDLKNFVQSGLHCILRFGPTEEEQCATKIDLSNVSVEDARQTIENYLQEGPNGVPRVEGDFNGFNNDCPAMEQSEEVIYANDDRFGQVIEHVEIETVGEKINEIEISTIDSESTACGTFTSKAEKVQEAAPSTSNLLTITLDDDDVDDFHGHLSSLIINRAPRAFVWDYFLKETHQAICLNCGKTFKGQRPNTICEQHLKRRHPEFYKILLEKKIKRAELHMNPMIMGLGVPSYDQD